MLRLREIMTRDVVTVAPELPLDELVELFIARRIGSAPVVTGRKVVGVVSAIDLLTLAGTSRGQSRAAGEAGDEDHWANESDLSPLEQEELPAGSFTGVWDLPEESLGSDWSSIADEGRETLYRSTVADVMSHDVLWLPPETGIAAAADFMRAKRVHRVLVMTSGELEGIVTSMDIVEAVAKQQIPSPQIVFPHEADFDPGWSHEPIVPEVDQ